MIHALAKRSPMPPISIMSSKPSHTIESTTATYFQKAELITRWNDPWTYRKLTFSERNVGSSQPARTVQMR